MFKKIEIWILYLVLVFVFISYIIFGAMVRREALGGGSYIPLITPISKVALFIAEIPANIKNISKDDISRPNITTEQRFNKKKGFIGNPLSREAYLLLARYDGNKKESVVELVDLKNFRVVHDWNANIDSIVSLVDTVLHKEHKNIKRDVSDFRTHMKHPFLLDDGSIIFASKTLNKINKNSTLEWMKEDDVYHHSIEEDFYGDLWICSSNFPFGKLEKYVGSNFENYADDSIVKISKDGKIKYKKSITEIFLENGLGHLIFGLDNFIYDPLHINDIQPVLSNSSHWKLGDLFISLRNQSMVFLYRPADNKIIWKSQGWFFHQHDVDILDDNRIAIFDNNTLPYPKKVSLYSEYVDGVNNVVIYDFENDIYSNYLKASLKKHDVRTITNGLSEILDNGDLFIEETNYGRYLYFNSDGSLLWEYINRANNGNVYKVSWSRIYYKKRDLQKIKKIFF